MRNFLRMMLDAVFPPKCVFCGDQKSEQILCPECLKKIEVKGTVHRFGEWKDLDGVIVICKTSPELRKAIHNLKYLMRKNVGEKLGEKMRQGLMFGGVRSDVLILGVPLHWSRKLWRGFNQAEELGREIAEGFGLEFGKGILKRKRRTRSQMGLERKERLVNLEGAFEVCEEVHGKICVLVDDVVTTGATLGKCAEVLKKAGAKKVVGLVLCRGI